jgi:hydroxymethylpyrimidine pyrophosphatase-like HAD family hydrolase
VITAPVLPIRLIALDIDGTIIGDDGIVGPRTRAAIADALDRDIAVSLVTGRMVSSAMRFARELRLTEPVVGYQGGLIRAIPPVDSPRLGRLLRHHALAPEVARRIIVWTREHGLDPHLNHLERFILRADDPNADDYSAFMGAHAELVPNLEAAVRHPITKVLAVGEPPMPVELAAAARDAFAGEAEVTISHPKFLEFVAPGVSKGRAVRYLARDDGCRWRRAGHRRPMERLRDAGGRGSRRRRCRRPRPRCGRWPATSPHRSRTRGPDR